MPIPSQRLCYSEISEGQIVTVRESCVYSGLALGKRNAHDVTNSVLGKRRQVVIKASMEKGSIMLALQCS